MSREGREATLIRCLVASFGLLSGCHPSDVVLGGDHSEAHAEDGGPITDGNTLEDDVGPPSHVGTAGSIALPPGPVSTDDASVGEPEPGGPRPSWLPSAIGACPVLSKSGLYGFSDGKGRIMMVVIRIAPDARSKPGSGGPIVLYWHSLGASAAEVSMAYGNDAIQRVLDQGGVVAAFAGNPTCNGCSTTDAGVWFEEDFAIADQVVACSIEQAKIDTRRIHGLGFSAGGVHALRQAWARSAYIASAVAFSGGILFSPPAPMEAPRQDPTHPLPTLLTFGGVDDVLGVSFKDTSIKWYEQQRARGSYTMMCEHAGGHMIPLDVVPEVETFFDDHPYKVSPEPYADGIPGGFPDYCSDAPL